MKLRAYFTVFSIYFVLSGCQSMAPDSATVGSTDTAAPPAPVVEKVVAAPATVTVTATVEAPSASTPPPPPADLWQRVREEMTWPPIENREVARARDNYLRQSNYLPLVSERASLYLYYIVEEVQRRGLPMELALVPLVESTLNPFAYSPGQAAGLWQIIPSTGEHLGLQQNWWFDGRRALRNSTRVALDYLEALHAEFDNDWLLALAAYNAGNGRVGRARAANARKGLPTDYWSLKLPRETRVYVPRLLALSQIIASPGSFGVEIPAVANAPAFEIAETGGQIELARAADLAQVSMQTLRELNPGQLRWATCPDQPPELLLPVGTAARFEEGVAQLTADDRVRWEHYRIQPGDSLIRIAKKFDTEVDLLRQANGIRGNLIRAGKTLMIPMGSAWTGSLAMAENGQPPALGYRVRHGDSLYRIAGKYKVSVKDIVAWNSLDPGSYLQPGQKLTLYVNSI